jgi:hypothetical protein
VVTNLLITVSTNNATSRSEIMVANLAPAASPNIGGAFLLRASAGAPAMGHEPAKLSATERARHQKNF